MNCPSDGARGSITRHRCCGSRRAGQTLICTPFFMFEYRKCSSRELLNRTPHRPPLALRVAKVRWVFAVLIVVILCKRIRVVLLKLTMFYYLKNNWMNLLPLNTIEDNMCMPLFRMSSDLIETAEGIRVVNGYGITMALSVVYLLIFLWLAWLKFKKTDV